MADLIQEKKIKTIDSPTIPSSSDDKSENGSKTTSLDIKKVRRTLVAQIKCEQKNCLQWI